MVTDGVPQTIESGYDAEFTYPQKPNPTKVDEWNTAR